MNFEEVFGKDHADSFLLLESGRADAFVMDGQILAGNIAKAKNPADFKIVGEVLSVEPIAIMFRKDDAGLQEGGRRQHQGDDEVRRDRQAVRQVVHAADPADQHQGRPAAVRSHQAGLGAPNDKPIEDYLRSRARSPGTQQRAACSADRMSQLAISAAILLPDTIDREVDRPTASEVTGGDITYLEWMLSAWGWTLVGGGAGADRRAGRRLADGHPAHHAEQAGSSRSATAWTELFRNIPLLVQIFLWYHVLPSIFQTLQGVPSFLLVVFALGFFTSARISEQVRAGIQSLPRGQRYAGLAMGLTLPQTYRFVLLPMAFRIVIPPLTAESMNIIKNSSVAFAVSIAELTMFAMQAQEETSRGVEIYLAVTVLYFVSAFFINRVAMFIENRVKVPGMIGERRQMNLDFAFLNWDVISSFILKGFLFSHPADAGRDDRRHRARHACWR